MDPPLWTERHKPVVEDLPQPSVRDTLLRAIDQPVNIILHGPPGVGKTAAANALGRKRHDDFENDFTVVNVADFFNRTKTEIRNDPRFERFLRGETEFSKQHLDSDRKYKSDWSKADMAAHVIKEHAGYAPSSGDAQTLLLDNAEAARSDFQQALRRIMEHHHETTRFLIATRQPTALIPAIRSRCLPVPVNAPSVQAIVSVLREISSVEEVETTDAGLEFIAEYADGNLREAILAAQTTAVDADSITREYAYEALSTVGHGDTVESMLEEATNGNFQDARDHLDTLLFDEGLSGEEVLDEVLTVARTQFGGTKLAAVYDLAGEVDHDLATGTSPRVHLAGLLARLGTTAATTA